MHGDNRKDFYYWMRDDRKDKKVIEYLISENKYSDSWYKTNKIKSKEIYTNYKEVFTKI